jgi:hypothetical protein
LTTSDHPARGIVAVVNGKIDGARESNRVGDIRPWRRLSIGMEPPQRNSPCPGLADGAQRRAADDVNCYRWDPR